MGQHASSFDAKIEWLVAHPKLLSDWPAWNADRLMLQGMKEAGLISKGTHNLMDFSKLVAEARKRARAKHYSTTNRR